MAEKKIALFCSHLFGEAALRRCLATPGISVSVVATDNINYPFTNAPRRLWRHRWDRPVETVVPRLAKQHNIPVFDGRVTDADFLQLMDQIQPDGILCCCYGQRLREGLLKLVKREAYNIHPAIPGQSLERTRGAQPFGLAADFGAKHIQLVVHRMTKDLDRGQVVAHGPSVALPDDLATWCLDNPAYDSRYRALWSEVAGTVNSLLCEHLANLFNI